MSVIVGNAEDIQSLVGEEVGTSRWVEVNQDRRFPAPVPSGSRVRMSATLAEATDIDSGVQVKIDCTFEVDGQERPACVARAVLRHHFAA